MVTRFRRRKSGNEVLRLLFPLALDKAKVDSLAASLVLLIDVFNEGLEVGQGLFRHFRFLFALFFRHEDDYSICSGAKPILAVYLTPFIPLLVGEGEDKLKRGAPAPLRHPMGVVGENG